MKITQTLKKQILDFAKIKSSTLKDYKDTENAIETPSVWQAKQPIYTSSVDRWKRYPQMIQIVENHLKNKAK